MAIQIGNTKSITRKYHFVFFNFCIIVLNFRFRDEATIKNPLIENDGMITHIVSYIYDIYDIYVDKKNDIKQVLKITFLPKKFVLA